MGEGAGDTGTADRDGVRTRGDENRAGRPPRVTIVVPTYRRPALLRESLEAIRLQTFTDYVTLVCDNSPDREAAAVVAGLGDDRFQYIPRERNLGILGNAVSGFLAARSPLVMEVDDDDLLHPDCLERLVGPFDADPELAISFGEIDVIGWDGQPLRDERRAQFVPLTRGLSEGRYQPFTALAAQGKVYLFAALIRRDAIDWDAVPADTGSAYDRHLGLAAARGNRAAYFVDDVVMAYRVHADADGVRHEADQLHGAIRALEWELPFASGDGETAIRRELAKRHLMFVRAVAAERGLRHALTSVGALTRPDVLRFSGSLVLHDYLPRKLRTVTLRLRSREAAWRRQRRRAGHGL